MPARTSALRIEVNRVHIVRNFTVEELPAVGLVKVVQSIHKRSEFGAIEKRAAIKRNARLLKPPAYSWRGFLCNLTSAREGPASFRSGLKPIQIHEGWR